jgi:hypothetical protein
MVKLIIGKKGTGKTKTLIEMVNTATQSSKGSVICIEKGAKLNYDVTHKARLIDTDSYSVTDGQSLFGFVAGILASNHDITEIFIDSSLKICQDDMPAFEKFAEEIDELAAKLNVAVVMTASLPVEECPESLKKYL